MKLELESINGSERVTYEAASNQPVPWSVTIRRQGEIITLREALDQLALDGPVGRWIRTEAVGRDRGFELDLRRLIGMDPHGPAYLPYRMAEEGK